MEALQQTGQGAKEHGGIGSWQTGDWSWQERQSWQAPGSDEQKRRDSRVSWIGHLDVEFPNSSHKQHDASPAVHKLHVVYQAHASASVQE
jgi:hypothetical protein